MDVDEIIHQLRGVTPHTITGRVKSVHGLSINAHLPGARIGSLALIYRNDAVLVRAEVVAFENDNVTLIPLGDTTDIGPDCTVTLGDEPLTVTCSHGLLGRVLDGLGNPADDAGPLAPGQIFPLEAKAPDALKRQRIDTALPTGVRAIDAFITLGKGQRAGLFAGSGVGKSTLLGQIASAAKADVIVIALVGERGREVREFLEDSLTPEGRARSVVICATSDAPAIIRLKSAYTATAVAESFRAQGKDVLLLMDSVTRFARAAREVALAAGQLPARRGYPASVFAELPQLLERTGPDAQGTITAIYTVLVEGGDMEEPIADEVRGILDGHIVLDRTLAERGHWPAINILESVSRVMPAVASKEHIQAANELRKRLALYESKRDLILLGAYKEGTDRELDSAITTSRTLTDFIAGQAQKPVQLQHIVAKLQSLARTIEST